MDLDEIIIVVPEHEAAGHGERQAHDPRSVRGTVATQTRPHNHQDDRSQAPAHTASAIAVDQPPAPPSAPASPAAPRTAPLAQPLSRRAWTWLRSRRLTDVHVVALLASALSIGLYAWYAHRGLTLAYTDAVSHIMIARRVVSSPTPGLAQFGTGWLPLHHILMTLLVWNNTLFHDGFAGAFPSMVAYVVSSVYLFRTGRLLFTSTAGGWVAALAFMLNPNVLYLQSTALSESELLCGSIVGVYYLLLWARSTQAADLVKAAAVIAATSLVRYDAWALALAAMVTVAYIAWHRHGRTGAESRVILFATLAFAGCAGWLVYNLILFHKPLAFYDGMYSAEFQQRTIEATSGLPTHNNLWLSLHVYSQTVIDTVGWPLVLVALAGLACWAVRHRLDVLNLPAYLMLVPFAFNVYALVRGVTIMVTPEIPFQDLQYYNVRYAIGMVPAAAVFLAFLVARRKTLLVAAIGVIVALGFASSIPTTPYILGEPLYGVGVAGRVSGPQEGKWIAQHYHGGHILISYAPDSNIMFYSDLPDKVFITDSNSMQFSQALASPQSSVNWIVFTPTNDNPVWLSLSERQDWRQYFVLRATFGTTQFYQRVESPTLHKVSAPPQPALPTQSDQAPPSRTRRYRDMAPYGSLGI